ncbi:MAG: glutamine-hydrolyzing carbamoyl-phosphate synthase small subunit [Prevotellaceae bacterium]|jgi:carbamoyl-phosphate synthase large subunit/carbamoyl-phosphate synthase small subunit|nr:glutamine-hydrolyzing carbamoyl-phosphate synthase small subunit [Prevotellaceae bacterium]
MKATLTLDNGIVFEGRSFGSEKPTSGEVVFSTAMMGYPESLTDPSYLGQILTLTFPLVGNYGVPDCCIEEQGLSKFLESHKIHVSGLVVSDYSEHYSHWNAHESLGEWLKRENVPAITGIDTRELTKILREKGSMLGRITIGDEKDSSPLYDPSGENLVAKASCKEIITYENGDKRVVLVDCGIKQNIIRCLLKRGVTVIRVPWDYDFSTIGYNGLFISNGPGSPTYCEETIAHIRKAMAGDKPIFGICMGNQLLSLASGAKVFKLKYGHRSHNQPVQHIPSGRCFVTSQNHGYAVDNDTLSKDWEPLFINLNDGTNEGIRHKSKPFFSAQFHPEASSGPTDTDFLFDEFVSLVKNDK